MSNTIMSLLPRRTERARWIGLGLVVFAIVLSLLALTAFADPTAMPDAWLPYVASTAIFALGCYFLSPRIQAPESSQRISRIVLIPAGIILLIAILLRFYSLETLPLGTWVDEADNGLSVISILNDSNYRPVFVDQSNPPAHLFYLIALSYYFLGASTFSSRLVIATFGVATVIMAFLAGREAHGNRFGLILAFFVAVGHWAITFSRIALHGMTTPFFVLLTVYLLLRSKRTGKLFDFALAGLAVGFGLCFYTAYRMFLPVIALFLLYWAVSAWRNRPASSGRQALTTAAINLAAFSLGAGLAVAPVAQYAILLPSEFWARSDQVSIFNQQKGDQLVDTLTTSTLKHVLMFNQRGDNNGRHNLPGEPMLDPVTGALFLIGLALAIVQPRNAARAIFLLSIPFGLLGGILTLDFEAPQSLRSIAALPGVFYVAALAVETFWRGLEQNRVNRLLLLVGAVLGAGYVLYYNAQLYFVRQAQHSGSWEAHNTVETLVARQMQALPTQDYTFYASMYFNQHTVIRFLVPQVTESHWIIPPNVFPIHEPGDKPVILFVDQTNPWITAEVQRYYPNAQITTEVNPDNVPILYTVLIPATDIANVQGLTAQYWSGTSAEGAPTFVRTEKVIDADWSISAPLPTPFVAEWSGIVYAPRYGSYEVVIESPAGAAVWIDDQTVLESETTQQAALTLAKGTHTLRVRATGGAGRVRLQWLLPPPNEMEQPMELNQAASGSSLETISAQWLYLSPPVTNNGLLGSYYPNADWAGDPAFQRIDPFVNTYFHIIPLTQRPYTVNWDGQIEAPTDGQYAFGLQLNGSAQVFVDGQLVVDAPEPGLVEGSIFLNAGRHDIRVHYLDHLGGSQIELYWTPPGETERQVIPSSQLWPYAAP